MTREEIVAEVTALAPWFHAIDLGHGVLTKRESISGEAPDHPHEEWQAVRGCLPADLRGKTVLDVGCNAGFFAVAVKRRGAQRVLGVDSQRHHIRQAGFVRRVLGLDIEFQRLSVYDLDPRTIGRFDITLALGLLYHCKHLVLALERLFVVTKDVLILESAILPEIDADEAPRVAAPGNLAVGGRGTHLLAYVENPPEAKEAVFNWFVPSVGSLEALLRNVGFDHIAVNAYRRDRAVLVCRKRRLYPDSRNLHWLSAVLMLDRTAARSGPGDLVRARVRATNTGSSRWLAHGEAETKTGAVRLGAHLLTEAGDEVGWDYKGVWLRRDVFPGDVAEFDVELDAPLRPGRYLVEFDLVSEHLAWFGDLGSRPARLELVVDGM